MTCGCGYCLQDNLIQPQRCHLEDAPYYCVDCVEFENGEVVLLNYLLKKLNMSMSDLYEDFKKNNK